MTAEEIQQIYAQLTNAARTLNAASDALGDAISSLEGSLRPLKIGVESWYTFRSSPAGDHDDIGYAKMAGKWRICIRSVTVNPNAPPDAETWPAIDGPRMLRVKAADAIPEFLAKLHLDTLAVSRKVLNQAGSVENLAAAIRESGGS